jgi:hypothetical protein
MAVPAKKPEQADPQSLLADPALETRLLAIEQRLVEFGARLDNAVSSLVKLTQMFREEHLGAVVEARPKAADAPISPAMLDVIRLIVRGEVDEAQKELQSISSEERNAQPAVVALAAAALFIQRGDFASGLKALKQAKSFTSDPRLTQVIERVAERAEARA